MQAKHFLHNQCLSTCTHLWNLKSLSKQNENADSVPQKAWQQKDWFFMLRVKASKNGVGTNLELSAATLRYQCLLPLVHSTGNSDYTTQLALIGSSFEIISQWNGCGLDIRRLGLFLSSVNPDVFIWLPFPFLPRGGLKSCHPLLGRVQPFWFCGSEE